MGRPGGRRHADLLRASKAAARPVSRRCPSSSRRRASRGGRCSCRRACTSSARGRRIARARATPPTKPRSSSPARCHCRDRRPALRRRSTARTSRSAGSGRRSAARRPLAARARLGGRAPAIAACLRVAPDVTTVGGDLAAGEYFARVRGVNGAGPGPASNEARFRVGEVPACDAPEAPVLLPATINGASRHAVVARAAERRDRQLSPARRVDRRRQRSGDARRRPGDLVCGAGAAGALSRHGARDQRPAARARRRTRSR